MDICNHEKKNYIVLQSSLKHQVTVIIVQIEHLLVLSNCITVYQFNNGTYQLVVSADNVKVLRK